MEQKKQKKISLFKAVLLIIIFIIIGIVIHCIINEEKLKVIDEKYTKEAQEFNRQFDAHVGIGSSEYKATLINKVIDSNKNEIASGKQRFVEISFLDKNGNRQRIYVENNEMKYTFDTLQLPETGTYYATVRRNSDKYIYYIYISKAILGNSIKNKDAIEFNKKFTKYEYRDIETNTSYGIIYGTNKVNKLIQDVIKVNKKNTGHCVTIEFKDTKFDSQQIIGENGKNNYTYLFSTNKVYKVDCYGFNLQYDDDGYIVYININPL